MVFHPRNPNRCGARRAASFTFALLPLTAPAGEPVRGVDPLDPRCESVVIARDIAAALAARSAVDLLTPPTPVFVPHRTACERSAWTARDAASTEARADFLLAVAKCTSRTGAFGACLRDLLGDYREARELAFAQFEARLDVCRRLGEDRYAPELSPCDFSAVVDNRYMPLVVGRTLVYRSDCGERTRVTTLADTFEIEGIECAVVHDVVEEDGEVVEDTHDWFAQHRSGDVWYVGEIARNFENGVLHDVEGSWKHGEDGALAGIQMKARPRVGDVYRQEFLLGEAEDLAAVVGTGETVTVPAGTFRDCVRTEEWTPLEPGVVETKYFAPGVGFVLGVNQRTGERTELVRIIDPR